MFCFAAAHSWHNLLFWTEGPTEGVGRLKLGKRKHCCGFPAPRACFTKYARYESESPAVFSHFLMDGAARRTDPPIHFSVRPRPTPRSSGEYISSASSYATSQTSSSFTLSSASSASSSVFDNQRRPSEASSTSNVLTSQLKKLYHEITHLETKIKQTDEGSIDDDQVWKQRIQDHKK